MNPCDTDPDGTTDTVAADMDRTTIAMDWGTRVARRIADLSERPGHPASLWNPDTMREAVLQQALTEAQARGEGYGWASLAAAAGRREHVRLEAARAACPVLVDPHCPWGPLT